MIRDSGCNTPIIVLVMAAVLRQRVQLFWQSFFLLDCGVIIRGC